MEDQNIDYNYTGIGHLIYHTVTYMWYDCIHKTPVLEISTSDITGFTTGHSKSVLVGSFVSGIEDVTAKLNLEVYPNPAHGEVHISFNPHHASDLMINVYNSAGVLVKNEGHDNLSPMETKETLDLSALSKGIYMIEVVAGEARTTRRIVVE